MTLIERASNAKAAPKLAPVNAISMKFATSLLPAASPYTITGALLLLEAIGHDVHCVITKQLEPAGRFLVVRGSKLFLELFYLGPCFIDNVFKQRITLDEFPSHIDHRLEGKAVRTCY